jgi:radical SAM superfamily enzyme YgiQ (UPF0313 family)
MKVLLINPPIEVFPEEFISVVPPLGLAYIAAVLEKVGHEVRIMDCLALSWRKPQEMIRGGKRISRLSPGLDYIVSFIKKSNPQIVGISNLFTSTEKETYRLAKLIKKLLPQVPIVVGGANASVRYSALIRKKEIDFVIIGEGEETMKELIETLEKRGALNKVKGLVFKDKNGREKVNFPRELINDLNQLPFPAWHLLPMEEYFYGQPAGIFLKKRRSITVLSSRGCPNSCSFCTNEKVWTRFWRARNVEGVIAEIRYLKKKYGVKEIQFVDSNISVDRQRIKKLCRGLKREKIVWIPAGGVAVSTLDQSLVRLMAESGCYALQFGIEHGNLDMQRRIGKIVPLGKTQELVRESKGVGIWTHGNFIVGLPGETVKTAYQSLDYAIKADFDSVSFFTALPLPGSRVYQEIFKQDEINLDNLRFYLSKVKCSSLGNKKIKEIIRNSFHQFLIFKLKRELHPSQIIRRVRQIRSIDEIMFYLRMVRRFVQISTIK